jgi:RNA polymerase sigma-70 factor (ECF subfamily)
MSHTAAAPNSDEADDAAPRSASASAVPAGGQGMGDAAFVNALRTQMVKFAHLHLSDRHLAEDAVQEALAGAWSGAQRFAGRAAIKTWVFAILKNKIADVLRHKQRVVDASSVMKDDEDAAMSDLFDQKGHWLQDSAPKAWHCPEASLEQQQFWAVLEVCLDGMPPAQARVFMMREYMGFETDEICTTVNVSSSNFFVLMHRARLRLRECLDQRWFAHGTGAAAGGL